MKLPRTAGLLIALLMILTGCGDYFRPVANPLITPSGNPKAQMLAVVVFQAPSTGTCADGTAPPCVGSTSQIDVSGDTNSASVYVGRTPVHAALGAEIYVANRDDDTVSIFTSLSPGETPISVVLPPGARPVYLAVVGNFLYVADSGLNQVTVIDPTGPSIVATVPVGSQPVALAGTPGGTKVYVANQGDGTVTAISTTDNTVTKTIPVGPAPAYVVANPNGTAVYVVSSGSATVSMIDTFADTVIGTLSLPAGAGSKYMAFDSYRNRLYVTNPGTNSMSVFDASQGLPVLLCPSSSPSCSTTVTGLATPTIVAPLADGSNVYVVDSGATTGCHSEATMGQVSVINPLNNTVRTCITVGPAPVWIAASSDSSKVYVPFGSAATPTTGTTIINTAINSAIDPGTNQMLNLAAPPVDPNCTSSATTNCATMAPVFVISQ